MESIYDDYKEGASPFELDRKAHRLLEGQQIVFFNCLGLYHKSPDSGERQDKSRA